jgi:peptidoglycan/xylan/chitin deacetylase (PgdA/CDA1 family)
VTAASLLNRACRRAATSLLETDASLRALSRVPGRGAVVLRYHSVNDDPVWARETVQRNLVVPAAVFDEHMRFLAERNRVVPIETIVEAVAGGRPPDPSWVAVTFDDGYEDNHRNAMPILKKHGVTAAFYVTTGCVGDERPLWTAWLRRAVMRAPGPALRVSFLEGGAVDVSSEEARERAVRELTAFVKRCDAPRARAAFDEVLAAARSEGRPDRRVMMNWHEIRDLRRAGMAVGAHSVAHWNLPSLSDADLEAEVRGSREALALETGRPVAHFSYPNGRTTRHFDARVARAVAGAGYASAVTSVSGAVSHRLSAFAIPRLGVYERHCDVRRLALDIERARLGRPEDPCVGRVSRELRRGAGGGAAVAGGGAPGAGGEAA